MHYGRLQPSRTNQGRDTVDESLLLGDTGLIVRSLLPPDLRDYRALHHSAPHSHHSKRTLRRLETVQRHGRVSEHPVFPALPSCVDMHQRDCRTRELTQGYFFENHERGAAILLKIRRDMHRVDEELLNARS